MLALDPPIAGFTTWAAEGHGFGFASASVSERVRGSIKRNVIAAVLPRGDADALVRLIAAKAAQPHLTYWIEPVACFGHMDLVGVPIDAAASASRPKLKGAVAGNANDAVTP